jgi:hypothetical protein
VLWLYHRKPLNARQQPFKTTPIADSDGRTIPKHNTRPDFAAPKAFWVHVISPAGLIIFLLPLTPAKYPLASAYQANQEALLIHIVYITSLKVLLGNLSMQQLKVETAF